MPGMRVVSQPFHTVLVALPSGIILVDYHVMRISMGIILRVCPWLAL